jgi:hypothetical protein
LPTCEAVLTIRPYRAAFIGRAAAAVQLMTPLTLTASTRSITDSSESTMSSIGWATPALLQRMSSLP